FTRAASDQPPGNFGMSSTALLYGTLDAPSRQRRPVSPRVWTCVGALAIPLWATWHCLAIRMFEIPPLEFLAMMFLVGWLVWACLWSFSSATALHHRPRIRIFWRGYSHLGRQNIHVLDRHWARAVKRRLLGRLLHSSPGLEEAGRECARARMCDIGTPLCVASRVSRTNPDPQSWGFSSNGSGRHPSARAG